jgi:uncharacterized membrane protein (UPF0127 family)
MLRKKKVLFFVLSTSFLILFSAIVFRLNVAKRSQVCFKGTCFPVELARTSAEQAKGLMFRRELGQDQGMLFIYDREEKQSFWMKNTLIPLDIIWINQDKEIVFISDNAQPCQKYPCPVINPGQKARYVWEIPGGRARAIGLKPGDQLELRY